MKEHDQSFRLAAAAGLRELLLRAFDDKGPILPGIFVRQIGALDTSESRWRVASTTRGESILLEPRIFR
jgi:hypothetical protein